MIYINILNSERVKNMNKKLPPGQFQTVKWPILYYNGDRFGYSANLPLDPLLGDDSLFVYRWKDQTQDWQDIDPKHGYPLRFIPPETFYLWKGSKWVSGIEFLKDDDAGFWEDLGYSMSANPFKEERYR